MGVFSAPYVIINLFKIFASSMGAVIILVLAIEHSYKSLPKFRALIFVCAVLLCILYGARTVVRNKVWHSREALFRLADHCGGFYFTSKQRVLSNPGGYESFQSFLVVTNKNIEFKRRKFILTVMLS